MQQSSSCSAFFHPYYIRVRVRNYRYSKFPYAVVRHRAYSFFPHQPVEGFLIDG